MSALMCGLIFLNACKEDPELPENFTEFEADQAGIAPSETELSIKLKLVRETEEAGTVTVGIASSGLVYGKDFTTDPAAVSNTVIVSVPAGSSSAAFKLKKIGNLFDGDETVKFTIQSTSDLLLVGEKSSATVTFGEILATSGSMELAGGGALYPNQVFVDLSTNRQTAISRTSWDLAFSSSDNFRVVLNSPNGMTARALTKTDLTTVTAADTVGFGAQLSLNAIFAAATESSPPSWIASALGWIDDPAGDLAKTAIAAVSATAADNKVYIVYIGTGPGNPAPALGWKKIRVIRNGSNYTLQHANISATTFTEVQITKNPAYRFQFVSFASGVINAEPEKTKWDIAWTGFTNTTPLSASLSIPYYFQDVVLQNTAGVQAVQVLTSTISYDAFAEANLAGLSFATAQLTIGSNWRSGGGPSTAPSVRTDRFYIVKDLDGNYFKLKFTALVTNGERGKPQIQFALVKKG